MSAQKGTPRALLYGVKDVSPSPITSVAEVLPQQLPLVPLLCQKGPLSAIVDSVQFQTLFGAQTLEPTSKFCNHQTMGLRRAFAQGGMAMIYRIKPTNAKTAMLRVSLELIPNTMPVYARESDGSIRLHPTGQPNAGQPVIEEVGGVPQYTHGYRAVLWLGTDIYQDLTKRDFGKGAPVSAFRLGSVTPQGTSTPLGLLHDATNAIPDHTPSSVLYPLFDLPVSSFGEWGNNIGLRLISPTTDDAQPFDTALGLNLRAFMYRLALVERSTRTGSAIVKEMLGGGIMSDLTFKQNAVDPQTGISYSVDDVFIDKYQKTNDPNFYPVYGPFGDVYVYHDQINALLTRITQGETIAGFTLPGEKGFDQVALAYGRASGLGFADVRNQHLLNIFSGYDFNGVPYYTLDVDSSVAYGGISLKGDRTVYASGGDDGLVSDVNGFPDRLKNLQIYDDQCFDLFTNFDTNPDVRFMDIPKYPISTIWDTGFSLQTKKAALWPMAVRKDIATILAPQSIGDYTTVPGNPDPVWVKKPRLTPDQERSITAILRSTAQNYPESTVYGTPVCRVGIVGHTGYLLNSAYTDFLPITIDLWDKVTAYMGASNGNWTDTKRMDRYPNNVVGLFRDVNSSYQNDQAYDSSWDLGLMWVQSSDTRQSFYPAFQTVYTDDTSTLNSLITVFCVTTIEKVVIESWIRHTGNTDLSDDEFIASVNNYILNRLKGQRFGNRFAFKVDTYFTLQDKTLGNRWTTDVHMYSNTMKSVGQFSIISHRLEELAA